MCANVYLGHQTNIGSRCLREHCVNTYMKNVATSPCCYHVVRKCVCLGTWTYWLTLIYCSEGCFLYMNHFKFFIQTQIAPSFTQIIRWIFCHDASSYLSYKVVPFNFPVFFRQFCVIYVIFMGKGFGVVVESLNNFSSTPK